MKTMIRTGIYSVSISLLLACTLWAGPFKASDVSCDAQWVAHLDVQGLVSSQIGHLFVSQLEEEGELQKIEAFGTIFEFNPLEDLHSVTAYGISCGKEEGVAIFKGRFDPEKLEALMKTEGKMKKISFQRHTLFQWSDGDETIYTCFYKPGVIVLSNSQNLTQKAVDVLDGEQESMQDGRGLKSLHSIPKGVFFAGSAVEFNNLIPEEEAHAELLKKAERLTILVGEVEGVDFVEATLEVSDEKTAEMVYDIAKGLKAIGGLIGSEEPELAELIKALKLKADGKKISFRLAKPAEEIVDQLKKHID